MERGEGVSVGYDNNIRKVKNFASVKSSIEYPDLIEIQKKAYSEFLQRYLEPAKRKYLGLEAVFQDAFPIISANEEVGLEYVSYMISEPLRDVIESKLTSFSYSAPLRIRVRLVLLKTSEVREQDVYLGDIPLLTEHGTFVFNGTERVVVNQLHRSPGAFVFYEKPKEYYLARIIPDQKGSWLEFEIESKGEIIARIDRRKKMPFTLLVRALGVGSNEEVLRLFYDSIHVTIDYGSLKDIQKYFGYRVIKNVVSPDSGEVLLEVGAKLNEDNIDILRSTRIKEVELVKPKSGTDDISLVMNSLEKDGVSSTESALVEFLKIQRPLEYVNDDGDPEKRKRNVENGRRELFRSFMDSEVYDLGPVGRYKINSKFEYYNVKDFAGEKSRVLRPIDIFETLRFLINVYHDVDGFYPDDIDHLGNRRVRTVGELLSLQFKAGLSRMARVVRERMSINDLDILTPQTLISVKPIAIAINEFFGTSQLSQFMDQTNPIAELTHKRRLNALGPGGLTRERAGFEVRDIHYTHYGRVCPIETPEGPNIGLILSLASYARLNEYGFIESPYQVVKDGVLTDEIRYFSANEEGHNVVVQSSLGFNSADESSLFSCRYRGDYPLKKKKDINLMDVSTSQFASLSTSLIPFLEHDDANRALMGANMQRQAVPLLCTEAPFVGTGIEKEIAYDSGVCLRASHSGMVTKVDATSVTIADSDDESHEYSLRKFQRTNQGTCINQRPIVQVYHAPFDGKITKITEEELLLEGVDGRNSCFNMKTIQGKMLSVVQKGDAVFQGDFLAGEEVFASSKNTTRGATILADGQSTENARLALGRNVTVAFMPFHGYNFEDAIVVSERLVREDYFTSIHIEEFDIQARETKLGPEVITRDIPNISERAFRDLDEDGVIRVGTNVLAGDVLVGMITPKLNSSDITPEYRLLYSIFGEKIKEVKDSSLVVPNGHPGIVIDVKMFSRENGDDLPSGVHQHIKVYVAKRRKLSVGDKLAGRHGNKGLVSCIKKDYEMPFLEDGTTVDLILNPLGVPSRMNLGQIFETQLGVAADKLGYLYETPVFDGATLEEIQALMKESNWPLDSKLRLRDGASGEYFDGSVFVGKVYMLKLSHMAEDKIHARATGPYSLVTQQPLGGKAHFGGQRLGEMEVWALEAYGAAYSLREFLTVKSDDMLGRTRVYESIVRGIAAISPGVPESFNVLIKEIRSLALDISVLDEDEQILDVSGFNDSFETKPGKIQIDSFQNK